MKFAYRCGLHGIPYQNYLKCIPDLSDQVELKSGPSHLVCRESRPPVLRGPTVPRHGGYLLFSLSSGRKVSLGCLNIPGIPELIPRTNC